MIVRWGLEELPGVLDDVGIDRPLLVASERWDRLAIPAAARWSEIPSDRIAVPPDVDGILGFGGGSAIDTAPTEPPVRRAVESELAAGTLAEARVRGLDLEREIWIARAAGRAGSSAAQAFVAFARERLDR